MTQNMKSIVEMMAMTIEAEKNLAVRKEKVLRAIRDLIGLPDDYEVREENISNCGDPIIKKMAVDMWEKVPAFSGMTDEELKRMDLALGILNGTAKLEAPAPVQVETAPPKKRTIFDELDELFGKPGENQDPIWRNLVDPGSIERLNPETLEETSALAEELMDVPIEELFDAPVSEEDDINEDTLLEKVPEEPESAETIEEVETTEEEAIETEEPAVEESVVEELDEEPTVEETGDKLAINGVSKRRFYEPYRRSSIINGRKYQPVGTDFIPITWLGEIDPWRYCIHVIDDKVIDRKHDRVLVPTHHGQNGAGVFLRKDYTQDTTSTRCSKFFTYREIRETRPARVPLTKRGEKLIKKTEYVPPVLTVEFGAMQIPAPAQTVTERKRLWVPTDVIRSMTLPHHKYFIDERGRVWNSFQSDPTPLKTWFSTDQYKRLTVSLSDSKCGRGEDCRGSRSINRQIDLALLIWISMHPEDIGIRKKQIGFRDGDSKNCRPDNIFRIDAEEATA